MAPVNRTRPPEAEAEARKLRELWDRSTTLTQDEFGERFDIGNQSAVGQFLSGRVPLSLKAAAGFARGLGVSVADFSPRLAAEIERLHQAANATTQKAPEAVRELAREVEQQVSSGRMSIPEVQALLAMLKARGGGAPPS